MKRPMSPSCKDGNTPTSEAVFCDNGCCSFFANCWDPAVRAWIVRFVGRTAADQSPDPWWTRKCRGNLLRRR